MREEGMNDPLSRFEGVFKAWRGWAFFFLKKSQIVSQVFSICFSSSHEFSAWGSPFHFTKNCHLPHGPWTLMTSATLCSSSPFIISGGGRGLMSF